MIENHSPIIQIVSFVFCAWFLKETVIAFLKSVFGLQQSLSEADKIRSRVIARTQKRRIS